MNSQCPGKALSFLSVCAHRWVFPHTWDEGATSPMPWLDQGLILLQACHQLMPCTRQGIRLLCPSTKGCQWSASQCWHCAMS